MTDHRLRLLKFSVNVTFKSNDNYVCLVLSHSQSIIWGKVVGKAVQKDTQAARSSQLLTAGQVPSLPFPSIQRGLWKLRELTQCE